MMPKARPATTLFSVEMASSSSVVRWPANTWVMAPSEYCAMDVRMAGPARYQSFRFSSAACRRNDPTLRISSRSSSPSMPPSLPLPLPAANSASFRRSSASSSPWPPLVTDILASNTSGV